MTTPYRPSRRDYLVVAALVVSCLSATLVQTMVIAIQPDMPRALQTSPAAASWIVTVTIGAACATVPIAGRLGDTLGLRRVGLGLVVALVIGSLIALGAPTIGWLLVGRAFQGLAISLIPISVSILKVSVSEKRLPSSLGFVSGSMGVGAALGIPIGAALSETVGWRSVFGFSAVTGVLALLLVACFVPPDGSRTPAPFDWIGAVTTASAAVLIVGGLGDGLGLDPIGRLTALAAGLALISASIVRMSRMENPLIDVRGALKCPVAAANAASLFLNFGMMSTLLIYPRILASDEGVGTLLIGLIMMAGGLSQAIAAPSLAQATRRLRPATVALIGCIAATLGAGASLLGIEVLWAVLISNIILGAGFGLAFAAIPRIIMGAVEDHKLAAANALNAQIRMFGTAGASAIVGAIISIDAGTRTALEGASWLAVAVCAIATLLTLVSRLARTR
ncbi:MFS transporter [Microbacterium sp. 22303]|uniref:MFS transporter n=1 Tax=Microbacterium sp. 22303 TaxID=3453905 RepID=UPI003F829202